MKETKWKKILDHNTCISFMNEARLARKNGELIRAIDLSLGCVDGVESCLARMLELEEKINNYETMAAINPEAQNVYMSLGKEIEKLTAENKCYKDALSWYANKSNYEYNHKDQVNYVWNDQGSRAQEALEKVE